MMLSSSRPSRRRFLASAILGVALLAGVRDVAAQTADGPALVILVRHAEKAPEPAGDPPLSAIGQERAKALLEALAHTTPSTIIVSPTKRTAETAGPLAAKFGLTPQAVSLAGGGAAHVNAVAEAVRKSRGTVVVVGHSNTIPAIIKALGGPAMPDICEASYANLYILHPAGAGKAPSLVRALFGAPDTAGATSCPSMMGR